MSDESAGGVVAVVVAYNRRALLLENLAALGAQSHPLRALIVIDNASSDGSADAAASVGDHVTVIRLDRNTGGAGGFAVGLERAIAMFEPEWVWLMDDDTIPYPDALEGMLASVGRYPGQVAIAGSRVLWTDGSDHPMNTPRRRPFVGRAARRAAERADAVAVRSSSFVSMLVRASDVRELGLPIADYFIWNDDFEFSTRLLRERVGLFVPSSLVEHRTAVLGSTDADPGERFYYEVRNKLWLFRASGGLRAHERLVYGCATALRWVRTIARSSNRRVLLRCLRRGAADGVRSRPRSNAESLADLEAVAAGVAAFERAGSAGAT